MIELMITVAIVGILAGIGIPSYVDYVERGKIAEATSALMDARVKMEQFFLDNRTYAGGCGANITNTGTKYFTVTCPVLTATTYTIQAAGGAPSTDVSMAAFAYSIDQANARVTIRSKWGDVNTPCWRTKRGSC